MMLQSRSVELDAYYVYQSNKFGLGASSDYKTVPNSVDFLEYEHGISRRPRCGR